MDVRHIAFKILNIYSTIWMSAKSRVELRGLQHLEGRPEGERRVYLVINHVTSYDLVALMHVAKEPFTVLMDRGAFTFPVIGHLFKLARFIPLDKDKGQEAVDNSVAAARRGEPLMVSLHDGDSTIGKWGRPRTGGIRIAHLAETTIIPVYIRLEDEKIRHLSFKGLNGQVYPYTTFRDTMYFMEFLPPVDSRVMPANSTYEDYKAFAARMDELRAETDRRYDGELARIKETHGGVRRRGGSEKRVVF